MDTHRTFHEYMISARKKAGLSRRAASELLCVSLSMLDRYERAVARIPADLVFRMSRVYHDPRLCTQYCETECAIGEHERPCGCEKPLESIMLDLMLMEEHRLPNVIRKLRDTMRKDNDDEKHSEAVYLECTAFLDEIAAYIKALRIALQTVQANHCK